MLRGLVSFIFFNYYILIKDAFNLPSWALLKTFVMMIGEFEFEGMFTATDDVLADPFPIYSGLLFIIFVLIMSIIIMNLLVGLAVDEIKEIQEHAELQKLSIQV